MWQTLLNFLIMFLNRQSQLPKTEAKPVEKPQKEPTKNVEIDWTKPTSKISKYFTVKDCLYLPSWECYHIPTEEEKANILKLAKTMDQIREYIGGPITITVWIRPGKVNSKDLDVTKIQPKTPKQKEALAELDYNKYIGGAKNSAHKIGLACDWYSKGISCDEVRTKLLSKLEEFDIRVEDLPGSKWVHTDKYPPTISGGNRFFKP